MDLEGFAKRGLKKAETNLEAKLARRILEIKNVPEQRAFELARAVISEAKATLSPKNKLLGFYNSGVTMGDFGVGSRGKGDFYVHSKIAEVIGETGAVIDSSQMDDGGVVKSHGKFIVVAVDGMHSRLSDFPFLAGFHAARASLRDVYVMGAAPVALFSDIHVADDGDVSKIFDYVAGTASVSEACAVPYVSGSTLRIGGDMVIGERMTGCVGAVGVADSLTPRKGARVGDVILMTEGSGGGTISTSALYFQREGVVKETLNVKFLQSCELLLRAGLTKRIHAMTDVTNGGIRGDANEIASSAGVKIVLEEGKLRSLVNRKVLKMLNELDIDYLGVSIDSLLMIAPPSVAEKIKTTLRRSKIAVDEVGWVEKGKGCEIIIGGQRGELVTKFRESAYTPLKKVVGETAQKNFEEMKREVDKAVRAAVKKKVEVTKKIKRQSSR
jgi:hydrogenase expression/formation protein